MPEGPEIRLAADRIANAVQGRVVRDAWFAFERLKRWERRLTGRRVRAVQPRGKALLVRFTGGLNVYSHNQLYGRWYVVEAGEMPQTGRQLRFALHTPSASALLYSASDIDVLHDADLAVHPYLQRLGPDALDRSVTPSVVRRRLEDKRFTGRSLGGLLLDQGFLCGIGNYLRSEILFVAGLDPARRPRDLEPAQRTALAKAALSISRRAHRTRGITNEPSIVKRMRAGKHPRREYRHFVFDRDGERCHRCDTVVQKTRVAGRRLYSCPTCQT